MRLSVKLVILLVLILELPDVVVLTLRPESYWLRFAIDVSLAFLLPLAVVQLLVKNRVIPYSQTGLLLPISPVSMHAGLALCLVSVIVTVYVVTPSLHTLFPESFFRQHVSRFPATEPLRIIYMTYAAARAAIVEEIVFRGVITSRIAMHSRARVKTVAISCLIFGAVHWHYGPGGVLEVALWAIIPTVWFLKRKTVWAPIIAHFAYNMWVFINYSA